MIDVGDRLPNSTLKEMTDDGPGNVDLAGFLQDRRVVIFGLPGAFTPTCHHSHLPGFLEHRETLKSLGVDEVAVVAVNDHFVMGEWAKATRGTGKIRYLADFDAAFTRKIGMDRDLSAAGLGVRSLRYSMIVDDGIVRTLNIEPKPGQADVSGAAHIIRQLREIQPA